jgi:tetratricopeptide (TPR) repeat protein
VFLWHEQVEQVDTWLFEVAFGKDSECIRVLSPGDPPPAGEVDARCMTDTNEVYKPTPYQASAKAWTPSGEVWAAIKHRSAGQSATVTILGFGSAEPSKALSRGRITITTSEDPVGAPIFYRDVPLAPSSTQEGVIKPLSDAFLPLIAWRLRDIAKPESRLLLTDLLTCTNCHSTSADGKTLGMDLDGPRGDKGAYVIVPITKQTVIEKKHVISWNSFRDKPEDHKTIGFLSRLSPDGRYAVTTLNEAVYVRNFLDYRFLQVFFPTRGILGYYCRETGEIKALPGADDPEYVHCDPVWTPDGKCLVFARAQARDPYPEGSQPATHANDPAETQIQYDLYRIPFDAGRGGKPEPISGASNNGMSNTFPKVSPDGRWIVFVKCRNGQLMRPDSTLWIVPAAGGTARLMRCNTTRMNSWHSFSPNGRWLVFSSKANTPYTQMFLTHLDDDGNDSPAILIPNSTAANRAVNIPEFVNVSYDEWTGISVPAVEYLKQGMRGIQFFEKGMLDEALQQFEAAVRSEPDYLEGHVSAAVILIEKGRLDEAAARLEKVLALDPQCWFAHANLGIIQQRKGMHDQAIAHFQTAIEINPNHLGARTNLGMALVEKGLLEEATVHFRAAVELAPKDAASRVDLGNVLLERGLLQEAVSQLQKAIEIDPRLVDARLGLGDALASQGEFESALAQLQSARAIDSRDPRPINGLAWLLATCPKDEIRDGPQAVQLAETACQGTGNRDPLFMRTLAAAYAEVGRWSEAVATATNALQLAEPRNAVFAGEIRRDLERYARQEPVRCAGVVKQPEP